MFIATTHLSSRKCKCLHLKNWGGGGGESIEIGIIVSLSIFCNQPAKNCVKHYLCF